MNEFMPRDFKPGDKVWFYGLKAKVTPGFDPPELWSLWAVPIDIQNSGFVTVAHVDQLSPRSKEEVKTWDEMKALEGKRVRVVLDWTDPEAFVEGVLELLDEYGQVRIQSPDGSLRYSWPALDMELL